jgi:hypothetical protein
VANLVGALDGTSGGTPVLWGAVSEGPGGSATSGVLNGMILCPANGADTFKKFNGNAGPFDASQVAVYQDNVQSFSTTEPAIDLTVPYVVLEIGSAPQLLMPLSNGAVSFVAVRYSPIWANVLQATWVRGHFVISFIRAWAGARVFGPTGASLAPTLAEERWRRCCVGLLV